MTDTNIETTEQSAPDNLVEKFNAIMEHAKVWKTATVTTDEDAGIAGEFVKSSRELWNQINDQRDARVRPLNERVKAINGSFQKYLVPLDDAAKFVRSLVDKHQHNKIMQERQRAKEAADEAARVAAASKVDEPVPTPTIAATQPAAKTQVRSEYGAVISTGTKWKYKRVSDIALVPHHLLMINEKAVNAYLASLPKGEVPSVPGIEFEEVMRSSYR